MRLLAVILIAVMTAACGDSVGPEDSYVTMTVDGTPWSATTASLFALSFISVTADNVPDDTGVSITVDNTGPGTYEIGTSGVAAILYSDGSDEWAASYGGGGSGQITVTRVTSVRVSGTFSGTLLAQSGQTPDTVTITNGSFEVIY